MKISTSEKIVSFIKGYGRWGDKRADAQTVMNGVYVASRLMRFRLPFKFETHGVTGVECLEIRRLFIDRLTCLHTSLDYAKPADLRLVYAGRLLSEVEPEKLGLIAQYIYSKRNHIFKDEADFALRTLKQLRRIVKLQIPLETAVLLM